MNSKKINVLIPDCDSGHTMAVVRCLKEYPHIILHGCAHDGNNPFRISRFTKSFSLITETAKEAYVEQVNAIIKDKKIDVILPISEGTYRFFSGNRAYFEDHTRLATMASTEILEIATNKYNLGKFCELHQVPSPRTEYLDAYRKDNKALQLPLIAKPERGSGGNNVYHIVEETDFAAIIPTSFDKEGNYIVQEYIDGYDIDMSLLAKNGEILAFTIQKGLIKRSNRFAASAGLEFLVNDGVYQSVSKLVSELKFSGIAHVDLRFDKNSGEFKIIEINARYWGSLIASCLAGVNFPYLHILSSMDEEIPASSFSPIQYMDFLTAVKSTKNSLFSRQKRGFRWQDTDYSFFLSDPIAEVYNAWKRSRN
jgi:D-aspartate ligase